MRHSEMPAAPAKKTEMLLISKQEAQNMHSCIVVFFLLKE